MSFENPYILPAIILSAAILLAAAIIVKPRPVIMALTFVAGVFLGFFVYSCGVAYLIEENLPNPEIAKGFVENFRMIILIGSLRIGELEEYLTRL